MEGNNCPTCGGPHDPGLCPGPKREYWLITYLQKSWYDKESQVHHNYGEAFNGVEPFYNALLDHHPAAWMTRANPEGKVLVNSLRIQQIDWNALRLLNIGESRALAGQMEVYEEATYLADWIKKRRADRETHARA